jgi:ATP-binding cassette, subfamily B, bacterial
LPSATSATATRLACPHRGSTVPSPALFAVVFGYTRRIKRAARAAAKAGGQVADVANEDLNAMVEVKAFGLQKREADIFAAKVAAQRASAFRAGRLQAEFSPIVLMLVAVSNAATISVGSWVASGHGRSFAVFGLHVGEATLTVGSLTVFLTYSKQLYQPMRDLSKLINLASMGSSAAERITAVLEAEPESDTAPTGPNARPLAWRHPILERQLRL